MFFFGGGGSNIDIDESRIDEILTRFVSEVIDLEHLKKRLKSGKKLRIKLGIDPTSPNLHIGRAVLLLKLRDFQQLGHKVVFIIGNATGVIGDTSDKDSERPMLERDSVEENARTYLEQAGRVLDMHDVEVKRNASWLDDLSFKEIGDLADKFSVADFIARDNIKRRLDGGTRVSLREVLYPLMQGYDSIAVNADVEIGGTDQRFNLLAGRTLQGGSGKEAQDILMTDLILGTDGRKMSSSWGNTINITDEPADMYGKVMRVDDSAMRAYFEACTRVPMSEIETILGKEPRDAKMRLAYEIVAMFHGEPDAKNAEEQFVQTFQKKEVPANVEVLTLKESDDVAASLVSLKLVESKSELRRLIESEAVRNADTKEKVTDVEMLKKPGTYKIGKRRFIRIET